jgi:hypothetical protein
MAISGMQTLHDTLIALTATMGGAVALAIVIIAVCAVIKHGTNQSRRRSPQPGASSADGDRRETSASRN